MTTYRVIIQPPAEAEIEQEAVESLSAHPNRCSLAPENDAFEHEIRHLLYGRKGRRYRVLLTVVGDTVHVLHFRHWAQQPMPAREIRGLPR